MLRQDRLTAFGLTAGDVAKAVRSQNVQLATGEVGQLPAAPGQQINAVIVTRSRLSTVEEFGDVIVRAKDSGSLVRVRDVARVELGAQDYSIAARMDAQQAASVAIRLAPSGNALEMARANGATR